jgi:hypothetical protein
VRSSAGKRGGGNPDSQPDRITDGHRFAFCDERGNSDANTDP